MSDLTYQWVEDVVLDAPDDAGHVGWLDIAHVLQKAWMRFLTDGTGLSEEEVFFGTAPRPITREVNLRFEAQVQRGDALTCHVRVLSRSTRAFTLEQVLTAKETGYRVATGTVVLVTVDPATSHAAEIPNVLWEAVTAVGASASDDGR